MTKFRRTIARWLYSLANWIDVPIVESDEFKLHVRELILDKERINVDGEYKRHMVYAELIKRFPDKRKRDIALAIELAINKL
jgi:hypothetical protein